MPFEKGKSGNPRGRPRQSADAKKQKERFRELLSASTVNALENIIQIANDKQNKDHFNACKFLLEKAYGASTAFLLDGTEEAEPVVITVKPYNPGDEEAWEREWDEA